MRQLFTDGINSVVHVVMGLLSAWNPILIIVFFAYQFFKHSNLNDAYAGILEYLIGYAVAFSSEIRTFFGSALP